MEVTVHYTAEVLTSLEEAFLQQVTLETLQRCLLPVCQKKKRLSLNAVAVSKERIRELNKTYRGKDKVTDILSFGEYADQGTLESDGRERIFLGEIFFCYEYIVAGAKEDGVTSEHEMVYVFSHGVLHLLGYDHEEEMFLIQDEVTEFLMKQRKGDG